jgi:hypothetical protein
MRIIPGLNDNYFYVDYGEEIFGFLDIFTLKYTNNSRIASL